MARDNNDSVALLERLEALLAAHQNDKIIEGNFTQQDIENLKRVAAREQAFRAIGALGASLRTFMTYVGFFIAAGIAIKAGLGAWLLQLIGK